MSDSFKTEEIKPDTVDGMMRDSKGEPESVSMPTVEVPEYQYGQSQNTLDFNVAIRNKPSESPGKYAKIYGSTNYVSTGWAQTLVTGLSTVVTNDTGMTWTANRIVITSAWYYSFQSTFRWFQPGSAAGDREIAILKNSTFVNNAKDTESMNGSRDTYQNVVGSDYCSVGDYIELYAYNYDGTTRNGNATLEVFKVS